MYENYVREKDKISLTVRIKIRLKIQWF